MLWGYKMRLRTQDIISEDLCFVGLYLGSQLSGLCQEVFLALAGLHCPTCPLVALGLLSMEGARLGGAHTGLSLPSCCPLDVQFH